MKHSSILKKISILLLFALVTLSILYGGCGKSQDDVEVYGKKGEEWGETIGGIAGGFAGRAGEKIGEEVGKRAGKYLGESYGKNKETVSSWWPFGEKEEKKSSWWWPF